MGSALGFDYDRASVICLRLAGQSDAVRAWEAGEGFDISGVEQPGSAHFADRCQPSLRDQGLHPPERDSQAGGDF